MRERKSEVEKLERDGEKREIERRKREGRRDIYGGKRDRGRKRERVRSGENEGVKGRKMIEKKGKKRERERLWKLKM